MPRLTVPSQSRNWPRLAILAVVGVTAAGCADSARFDSNPYASNHRTPPQDVEALETALETYLFDDAAVAAARVNVRRTAAEYRWSAVLAPLVEFCRSPRRAADHGTVTQEHRTPQIYPRSTGVRQDLKLVREYLAAGGIAEVARRARGRFQRRAATP